jgi:hypothetical protein
LEGTVKAKAACCSLVFALTIALAACSSSNTSKTSQPGVEAAVSDAIDAYIYGYPLVTMDMTRRQMTNVAVPDAGHAPLGQLVRMPTYPPVDYHAVTAPNADTLLPRLGSTSLTNRGC